MGALVMSFRDAHQTAATQHRCGLASRRWISTGRFMAYQFVGLHKREFLEVNKARLRAQIEATNQWLATIYLSHVMALTEADVWVIVYSEAAIDSNGVLDPNATHSNGEKGLLPLPENITYWIGNDAPIWSMPMSLDVNIASYMKYLGQIKNKSAGEGGGYVLYRDLFRIDEFAQNAFRQAKLVAGVVHGYFIASNYRNDRVDYAHLIECYETDVDLTDMMAGSTYKQAWTLLGRQQNIATAVAVLGAHG
jgi:hypothetical protein